MDREITEKDIVDFVKKNQDYTALIERFGKFTAADTYKFYELSDKKHYVKVETDSAGSVTGLHLYDSEEYVKTLWEK